MIKIRRRGRKPPPNYDNGLIPGAGDDILPVMKRTVPFKMQDVFGGFAETEGILSTDGTNLTLEFRTSDAWTGLLKTDVRQVTLPLDVIEEITFRKRWFRGWLAIRVSEMRAAADIPNFKQGETRLSIAKRHCQAAAELVSSVQLARAAK
jgi:hypothetical protein